MSPKSTTLTTSRGQSLGRPTMALWSLASPWITPRRSAGSAGTTSSSYRSRTRSSSARRAGASTSPRCSRTQPARARSHLSSLVAAGWVKSSRAASICPSSLPRLVSISGEWGRARARTAPGTKPSAQTIRRAPSTGTLAKGSPASVGWTRGSARCGARRARCSSAAHCSSTSPGSRDGCMTFRTRPGPSPAARWKLASCSPGRASAVASRP